MKRAMGLCLSTICCSALTSAPDSTYTVGFRQIEIADPVHDLSFAAIVFYPSDATTEPVDTHSLGPFTVNAMPGLSPAEGSFPIVVLSHGRTGTNLGYFTIAEHLAVTGHIVALPLHHRDNYRDGSLAEADITLELRPRHVSLTIDAVATDDILTACADTDRAAIIGHSMGGYTALAVAGGRPSTLAGQPVPTVPDPRVRALVLLAPATFWYDYDGTLSEVTAPILLLTGELDDTTPGPVHAAIIRRSLPAGTPLTHEVIPGAGHYAFLAPFPEEMRQSGFAPAIDPAGFDRAAFHRELPAKITAFLDSYLRPSNERD